MANVLTFLPQVLQGLFSRPATRRYPTETRQPYAGTRGEIANDPATCILCGLCAKRCPTGCIQVDKQGQLWAHDPFACVLCGWCVEVCPTGSLSQTETRPTPMTERSRTELHPNPPARHKKATEEGKPESKDESKGES